MPERARGTATPPSEYLEGEKWMNSTAAIGGRGALFNVAWCNWTFQFLYTHRFAGTIAAPHEGKYAMFCLQIIGAEKSPTCSFRPFSVCRVFAKAIQNNREVIVRHLLRVIHSCVAYPQGVSPHSTHTNFNPVSTELP